MCCCTSHCAGAYLERSAVQSTASGRQQLHGFTAEATSVSNCWEHFTDHRPHGSRFHLQPFPRPCNGSLDLDIRSWWHSVYKKSLCQSFRRRDCYTAYCERVPGHPLQCRFQHAHGESQLRSPWVLHLCFRYRYDNVHGSLGYNLQRYRSNHR
ncbi:hypothetical protein BDV98DRAFT_100716 [Pterulicium gracile]|uniref:Uncharacterized protein n=1 Tax=Pterulicium gracile TaxID=1884261 RepID=A0A5C3QEE9_9AGAR|nr:hypothetical protein BDV98DRAFT_100716 [Pterula gracilis]